VEQFRIYEALEAGAIPVLSYEAGYLAQHMPKEYLESPMLILNSWESLVDEMLAVLSDPVKLDARQQAAMRWYQDYMQDRARRVEEVLEEKANRNEKAFCHRHVQFQGDAG
jgi:hypothetical protein